MNRDSTIYKLRRKIQALAFYILPHEILSKAYYYLVLRRTCDLSDPVTFNEKLQWLKLNYFPYDKLAVQCSDKYQVREYITKKGMGQYLIGLIGVWEDPDDIEWDKLPQRFMLKCTHGCAYNISCADKSAFDVDDARLKIHQWMSEKFGVFNVEPHYNKIFPHRIICEEYLGDVVTDYKFFCFHGEPKFFYVSSNLINDRQAEMGFFDMDGKKIHLIRNDYKDIGDMDMPDCLSEMVSVSRSLSEDFPFVRVDFFQVDNGFKFGEMTFTPAAAMMPIEPRSYDYLWGEYLDLPSPID